LKFPSAASALLQFAAVLNESKKKCREWQAKAQEAEERLENVRRRIELCVFCTR
jgi:hypothetical protein